MTGSTHIEFDKNYLYKLKSISRGGKRNTPIVNTCKVPYHSVVVDFNSNCFICNCDAWLPLPVGQVLDFKSLDEVWNSPKARILQQNIDQKKFTWCAVEYCGIAQRDLKPATHELSINIDESCNLACPSCRRELIMHSGGPEFDLKVQGIHRIMQWLEDFSKPIRITLSGNGDPFASSIIRPLMQAYKPKPIQTFKIFTNGLLIKKQLPGSPILANISQLAISVDAGSKQVYEDVRRPGKWEILLDNFDCLVDLGLSSKVFLNFCLQQKNYRDLYAFVELCNTYGFTGVVHQLDDWGTWVSNRSEAPDTWTIANGTYLDQNVLNPAHPEHLDCLKVIQTVKEQKNFRIQFTNVIKNIK